MVQQPVPTIAESRVNPHLQTSKSVLAELFGTAEERGFRTVFWDGSAEGPADDARVPFTLVLRWPGALRHMLLPPSELSLAEAYLRDEVDVLGDMEAATALADVVAARLRSPARLAGFVRLLLTLPTDDTARSLTQGTGAHTRLIGRRHSPLRDRVAVRAHYDVGNDFYSLWLDSRMVYSCAYFTQETDDLDTAQVAKLDYVCRKLRLGPGERLLDIGCGWGGLVMHAAEHYGVLATGITLSELQASLARERIEASGLGDRCQIEVRDYREFPAGTRFDKIASVGMVEHVGRARLDSYFAEAFRLLEPGGTFLNHGIVKRPDRGPIGRSALSLPRIGRAPTFINRYVFPDGELVPLGEVVSSAERAGFEVRDVESLREHYALTLRHWVRRLEATHERAASLVGEATYRFGGSTWPVPLVVSRPVASTSSRRCSASRSLTGRPGCH